MPGREFAGVGVLAGAMFFRMFGVFVALPLAAVFAAGLDGGDAAAAVGLAVGGYGITQALLQIPAGGISDRWGRKPTLICMLLIFSLGGFVAATAETVWQLAAGRLLQGGGAAAAVTAAWIADITAPSRRARAMMVYGIGIALAFAASLLLAPSLAKVLGIAQVFALSGWLGLASAAAVMMLPAPAAAKSMTFRPTVNRPALSCAALAFVSHYALAALFLQIPLQLQETLPLGEHWQVYAPAFFLSLPLAVPWILREKSPFAPPVSLFLLAAGAMWTLSAEGEPLSAAAGMTAFFGGFVALEALIPARASRAAAADRRGATLGMVMSMEFLGMFCGAAFSGILLDIWGEGAMLAAMVLLIGGGFAIMPGMKEKQI